ncbi:DUF1882 domain-containing protein [Helicobacter sp. 11S02629-2]|uniref:DUF1882 domain-containing protein n=1 Tax=Helicobacter sp. 11S02629-2 TaxID=1476195 RepID=UPI000BA52CFB|nr:DUF1882 domain-containing protein [Helicobacter sp. 11S02629-2]PAF45538.1 ABC transporter [Helicobacter sp. 11S02629-2]
MQEIELKLIKMDTTHYFKKVDGIGKKIVYLGKTFYDNFERVDAPLTSMVIKAHLNKEIVVAHDLLLQGGKKVENIVFDYNGYNPERFYHKAQLILREEGYQNFTAYNTANPRHLHLYIHKGHTEISEGRRLAKSLSMRFSQVMPIEWRVLPTDELPPCYNILTLPYGVFAKERGSWSKYM